MRTIAVALQKGGTGKTTTTATLSHALARRDYWVLAVDLDSQGHLARAFGLDPAPALYDLLITGRSLTECIIQARPNLDLVRSNKSTAEAKEILAGRSFREQALGQGLKPAQNHYDYVFLDCAPSLDILNINALVAADELIIPVAVDHLATVGLAQHLESLAELYAHAHGHDCKLSMIIPTFYDRVTRESHNVLQQLADHFRGLITTPVPRSVRLREAPAYGKTIWEHAPQSPGAIAYTQTLERLLNDEK